VSDTPVVVAAGGTAYRWLERWADVPHGQHGETGWAHHAVVVASNGDVVTFHPGSGDVIVVAADGVVRASWPTGLLDGHGMTLVDEDGVDHLWIADPAVKQRPGDDGTVTMELGTPAVVEFTLDGRRVRELQRPDIETYRSGEYRPTWVVVDVRSRGGSGDIWVADGYGSSLVHRHDAEGRYLATIDGSEGAGRFNCPHALIIDRRRDQPELYVADRGNARLQVYGLDGGFRRVVGEGVLNSPSALAVHGELLVVGELFARLAVLDADDRLVGHLGENAEATSRPGWPNRIDENGATVRAPLEPGKFNSPHGLAVDAAGNLLVAEWLIGGRMPKLLAVR
jgi:hypothetical protein